MNRLLIGAIACIAFSSAHAEGLDEAAADRFAQLALDCVHKEYPNKISHFMTSDADLKPPRQLTPAFYGCYDWHSTVHGHWLLARVIKLFPKSEVAQKARAALALSLTPQNIAAEVTYITAPGRESFERPYGIAWLLQLAAELRSSDDKQLREWSATLAPLEAAAARKLTTWLPKLSYPIRIGEHDQTAFAFGLVWDWAQTTKDQAMEALLREKAQQFYLGDKNCPLAYEPSGQDFLSPCLAEADFVRRVLAPREFASWLTAFLPQVPSDGSTAWLPVARITDRSDPKLAHLDGLNLSRAWMLEGIARGLPSSDKRVSALRATAKLHTEASLGAVTSDHYVGSHWLGTFALYGASRTMPTKGLRAQVPATEHEHLTEVACVDVPPGEKRPEFGCFNVGTVTGLHFSQASVYWHLRAFPSRKAAEAAKSATGIVVEEDGRVWLSEFGPQKPAPQGGEAIALVGPLQLPTAQSYAAVLSYAVMRPGDSSRVHTHPGPEGWYVLAGEQCLDTPAGAIRGRAGGTMTVPANVPMELNITGTAQRRAFALVIHDSAQERGTPSDWKPSGACSQ